jgi:hypothetical protein
MLKNDHYNRAQETSAPDPKKVEFRLKARQGLPQTCGWLNADVGMFVILGIRSFLG